MGACRSKSDDDEKEEEEITKFADELRHRPDCLESLQALTKFSRHEIQLLYRGFKEVCPTGVIELQQFERLFLCWFPNADDSLYAKYVFNSFDRNSDGVINFQEFLIGMSTLSRGTQRDKLDWTFTLYDLDHDEAVSLADLYEMTRSVHLLIASGERVADTSDKCLQQAMAIFNNFRSSSSQLTLHEVAAESSSDEEAGEQDPHDARALAGTGDSAHGYEQSFPMKKRAMSRRFTRGNYITREQFVAVCEKNATMSRSLAQFDTVLHKANSAAGSRAGSPADKGDGDSDESISQCAMVTATI